MCTWIETNLFLSHLHSCLFLIVIEQDMKTQRSRPVAMKTKLNFGKTMVSHNQMSSVILHLIWSAPQETLVYNCTTVNALIRPLPDSSFNFISASKSFCSPMLHSSSTVLSVSISHYDSIKHFSKIGLDLAPSHVWFELSLFLIDCF